jgi:hypothetical protein
MANTRNQDLQASINQAKESIQQVTSEIGSTNSHLAQFETQVQHQFDTMDAKFMNQFNTLQSVVNQLLNRTLGPSSSDQPDVVDSSHSLHFQSNSFHRDPRLPALRSINLMALIPRVGSLKWSIIFLCMVLLMSWPNFAMLSSI